MQSARTRLVVLRRGDFKGEREIEIPLPFDSSLVTFCLHRKSLAPEGETIPRPVRRRNNPISFADGQSGRIIFAPTKER